MSVVGVAQQRLPCTKWVEMTFTAEEKEYLRLASVTTIVPQDVSASRDILRGEQTEDGPSLLDTEQRKQLFFDEVLSCFVVLRIPQGSEEQLKSWLERLELGLEIWAINEAEDVTRPSTHPNSGRELVLSHQVKHDFDPFVLVSQGDDDRVVLNLVWETTFVLRRPQMRMQSVYIAIHPTAAIASLAEAKPEEEYLEPFQPQQANLFQPLKGAKGYGHDIPFLSSARLRPVLPMIGRSSNSFQLHSAPSNPIQTYPAVITRIRHTRALKSTAASTLMASLDIEVIPFVEIKGSIEHVELSLSHGDAIPLMDDFLPIECQSRDCVTFLYRLEADPSFKEAIQKGSPSTAVLSIAVKIEFDLPDGGRSLISMDSSVNVDFTQMATQLRPSSLAGSSLGASSGSRSMTAIGDKAMRFNPYEAVTISFSAPSAPAQVGKPFAWQIFIVNKTSKVSRLAIIVLPRIQKAVSQAQNHARRHAPRISNTSFHHFENTRGSREENADIAQAFMDENVLYAKQRSGAAPAETDLISLTPELRIGPLGPGQCHQGEIQMVAFKSGAFMVDAVRVIDMAREAEEGIGAPGVITDIRDLPDVIVVE